MKKIFLILLLPFVVLAQYTKNDSLLVRTTFHREFNKSILSEYLTSAEPQKIKAALLSISNSSDTSYIPDILSLNFSEYQDDICFALGQIGPSLRTEKFLLDKITFGHSSPALLQALGKSGNSYILDTIAKRYNSSPSDFEGISLALFYLVNRHQQVKQQALPLILNELQNKEISKKRQADASFALYRLNIGQGPNDVLTEEISNELSKADTSDDSINKLYYLLGCLRLNKFFPQDKELFDKLLTYDNNIIRIEACRLLCYYPFNNDNELNDYLALLNDKNPNVSRTAATALKELKLSPEKNNLLKDVIRKNIHEPEVSVNAKGELLKSYTSLFKPPLDSVLKDFSSDISPSHLYQSASEYKTALALSFLIQKYQNESGRNKLTILQGLIDYQDKFRDDPSFRDLLLNSLASEYAPLISIAADGMDSIFIENNSAMISSILPDAVSKYMDNADFIESIFSLTNLAEKTDTTLYSGTISSLKKSKLSAIQEFVNEKTGITGSTIKDEAIFDNLWKHSFKYETAVIKTTKGNFTIRFLPQFAPVTVGSFCSLAAKDFFNSIIFHRVVPAFVIQAGDPTQTGWGGPGYNIVSELSAIPYAKGIVGMASAGKDTEGSQWFVTTGYYPHLNGRYSVFAEVTEGMYIINSIDQDDRIVAIELIER